MLADTVLIPDAALNVALHFACGVPLDTPLTTDDLATLTTLTLSDLGIENLEGMEYCSNLKSLDISANSFVTLDPILSILTIEYLNLSENFNITDVEIQKISKLINIEELSISTTQIATFEFSSNMKELTTVLAGYSSGLLSLDGIQGAISLERLDLSRASVLRDISPLESLPALNNLDLSYCKQIEDFTPINNIASLTTLTLEYCNLRNVDFIANQQNLKEINLGGNLLESVSPLSAIISLTDVAIQDNYISDLTPLSTLTNVTRLYLQENCITSLSSLLNLSSLVICNVADNYLTDSSEIAEFTTIPDFHFENNFFVNIPNQNAFSMVPFETINIGEVMKTAVALCSTSDGVNYELMESRNSNGFTGINASSSNSSVLSVEGISTYINGITSLELSLTGLDEGTGNFEVSFSFNGSGRVNLPLTNGAYEQTINVVPI